ncbi:MAG TPA: phasin [Xanthobacteraceae bacterium]|nr:phasin [Xanthobacteraceae bacterium]
MAEAKKAAKAAASAFEQASETLKADFPKFSDFEIPRFEIPSVYRDLAEKGIAQARQNYERYKSVAEDTNALLEATYTTAFRGLSEYGLKALEAVRANTNAQFDFARDLLSVKSASEALELSSSYARRQFDAFSEQGKELASLAQKVSAETAEPIKAGIDRALRVVA